MITLDRRRFLETAAAVSALAALRPRPVSAAGAPKTAVLIAMRPKELSYRDRFQMAVDAGFAGIEMRTVTHPREAEEVKEASAGTGLRIHSVMNEDHWAFPLSSPEPPAMERGVAGMETSLPNAKLWGADAVLLVPAAGNPQTPRRDARTRSPKRLPEPPSHLGPEVTAGQWGA